MHRFCTSLDNLDSISHQIQKVLRMRDGEQFVIFDGESDLETVVEIVDVRAMHVKVIEERRGMRDFDLKLHVFVAPPKKGALTEEMLEKLSEVGAASLSLFESSRCEYKGGLKSERCANIIKESAEQSWRTSLLGFDKELLSWSTMKEKLSTFDTVFVASVDSGDMHEVLANASGKNNVALVIGPEGGLSEDEIQELIESGALRLSSKGPVMRVATAAVSLSAMILNN